MNRSYDSSLNALHFCHPGVSLPAYVSSIQPKSHRLLGKFGSIASTTPSLSGFSSPRSTLGGWSASAGTLWSIFSSTFFVSEAKLPSIWLCRKHGLGLSAHHLEDQRIGWSIDASWEDPRLQWIRLLTPHQWPHCCPRSQRYFYLQLSPWFSELHRSVKWQGKKGPLRMCVCTFESPLCPLNSATPLVH